mgnify:CR=1 FL=1
MISKGKSKMSEKYTKYEIVKMVSSTYNQCRGCFSCAHYRPMIYGGKGVKNNNNKLFKCSDNGCFYAAELPWDDTKWCWFYPPKNSMYVDKLWALTTENLVKAVAGKNR